MPSFFVEDPVEDDLVQWAHASHELPESFDWNNMYVKGFKMVVGGVPFAPAIIKKVVSNMVKKLDFDSETDGLLQKIIVDEEKHVKTWHNSIKVLKSKST